MWRLVLLRDVESRQAGIDDVDATGPAESIANEPVRGRPRSGDVESTGKRDCFFVAGLAVDVNDSFSVEDINGGFGRKFAPTR